MIVKSINKRILISSENYIVIKKVKGKFINNMQYKNSSKKNKYKTSIYIQGGINIMPKKYNSNKISNSDTGIIYY